MGMLFEPGSIGSLRLPNRIVRSATAERMADESGVPLPRMTRLYEELARGGSGLIIFGHMYVDPSGKAHPGMTGIYDDRHIAPLSQVVAAVHREGGKAAAQINHGGMKAAEDVDVPRAPSDVRAPLAARSARGLTGSEIESIVRAFGQAARRAVEAGFDAVQIHCAHGYLGSQFLSPVVNRRKDAWGGTARKRSAFLSGVAGEVRRTVGPAYPILVKLGMVDGLDGGLGLDESLEVVESLEEWGIDALEISGGLSEGRSLNIRTVRERADEAYFLPVARRARDVTRLPILLVGGFRSRSVMEQVLESGCADFVSLSRPLVCEPDLPRRFVGGVQTRSSCVSGNRCWPESESDVGISCKCLVRPALRSS